VPGWFLRVKKNVIKNSILPVTSGEMRERGWDYVDVVIVSGDAYVDHPSFGSAVIGRVLADKGYRVGIIPQPVWREPSAVSVFGKPRLFFAVTAGNIDSSLSMYTAFKKVRNDDPYSPEGAGGMRPRLATLVYCNLIKSVYRDVPVVLGGIEASMRRLPYYDFWENRVRRSILLDAKADILVYGMGELQIADIAGRIAEGKGLAGIPGTVEIRETAPCDALMLPPEEEVLRDPDIFGAYFRDFYLNQGSTMALPAAKRFLIQNPPPRYEPDDLDRIYGLPYSRRPHPVYGNTVIPAFEMIKDSITSHRGCVSGCAFCSLGLHQGRRVVGRSRESILEEVDRLGGMDYFRGHVRDIGGPSANMYGYECRADWKCRRDSCVYPDRCGNLVMKNDPWITLLGEAAGRKGVRHVTVGSGVRYDLLMKASPEILRELAAHHVSGQLKIAPEHTDPEVLRTMRKAPLYSLKDFAADFSRAAAAAGRKLYLVPYFMSCHPGCGIAQMRRMREDILGVFRFLPEQVQAFIPLPMTLSSVMYYAGRDPLSGERVFVERDAGRRRAQHEVFRKGKG